MGWHTSHCSLINSDLRASLISPYLSNRTECETIPDRRYGSRHDQHPCARGAHDQGPLQILIGFLASSLVVFGIVVYFALPNGDYPPIWVPSVFGSLAVISHLISRTVGFNLKPVPAGAPPTEAIATARAALYASTILRFALSELVAIVALSLSFTVLPAS